MRCNWSEFKDYFKYCAGPNWHGRGIELQSAITIRLEDLMVRTYFSSMEPRGAIRLSLLVGAVVHLATAANLRASPPTEAQILEWINQASRATP